jgi:hypothetical protein
VYLNVHYRVHNSLTLVPLMNQIRQVTTPSYLLKIHCNISLPSKRAPFKWIISLKLTHQNCVCTSPLFHKYEISPRFLKFLSADPNSMWRRVQIVRSPMCLPPVFRHCVLLRPDRLPKDPILNIVYVLPSFYQTESHNHKKHRAKLY